MSTDQSHNARTFNAVREFGAAAAIDHATWAPAREEAWIPIRRVRPGLVCDFCWKPIPSGSPGNTTGSRGTKAWLSKDRGVYEHMHCRTEGFRAEQQWRDHVDAREAAIRGVRHGTRQVPLPDGYELVDRRDLVLDPIPPLLEIDVRDYAGRLALEGWTSPIGVSRGRLVVRGDRRVIAAEFLGLQLVPVEVVADCRAELAAARMKAAARICDLKERNRDQRDELISMNKALVDERCLRLNEEGRVERLKAELAETKRRLLSEEERRKLTGDALYAEGLLAETKRELDAAIVGLLGRRAELAKAERERDVFKKNYSAVLERERVTLDRLDEAVALVKILNPDSHCIACGQDWSHAADCRYVAFLSHRSSEEGTDPR